MGRIALLLHRRKLGRAMNQQALTHNQKEIKELEKAGVKWEEIDFSQIEKEAEEFNRLLKQGSNMA